MCSCSISQNRQYTILHFKTKTNQSNKSFIQEKRVSATLPKNLEKKLLATEMEKKLVHCHAYLAKMPKEEGVGEK